LHYTFNSIVDLLALSPYDNWIETHDTFNSIVDLLDGNPTQDETNIENTFNSIVDLLVIRDRWIRVIVFLALSIL